MSNGKKKSIDYEIYSYVNKHRKEFIRFRKGFAIRFLLSISMIIASTYEIERFFWISHLIIILSIINGFLSSLGAFRATTDIKECSKILKEIIEIRRGRNVAS